MTFNYVLNDKEVKDFDENYGTKLFSSGKGFLSLLNGEVTVTYRHGNRFDNDNKGYVFIITIMNGPLANREIIQKKEIGSAIYSEVLKLAEQFKKNQDEKTKAQIINEDDLIKRLASEGPAATESKKAEPKKAEPKKTEDNFSAKFVSVDEKGNKVEKTFDNPKDFDNYIFEGKFFDSSLDGLFKDIFKFEEVYNYQEKTEKSGNGNGNGNGNGLGNRKGWWVF